jgi:hypothetical protein
LLLVYSSNVADLSRASTRGVTFRANNRRSAPFPFGLLTLARYLILIATIRRTWVRSLEHYGAGIAIHTVVDLERSSRAFNPLVDLITKRCKVNGLGQKRLRALLQRFTLRLRIAISGDHDDWDVWS